MHTRCEVRLFGMTFNKVYDFKQGGEQEPEEQEYNEEIKEIEKEA